MPSSGFAGSFDMNSIPVAHLELVYDIQFSVSFRYRLELPSTPVANSLPFQDQVTMPTNTELEALVAQPDVTLDNNVTVDRENFEAEYQKHALTFTDQAPNPGAKTNRYDSLFLGEDASGNEIWASLISSRGNKYVCDLQHRAVVLFQRINDMRADPGVNAVVVSSVTTLAEVAQWDGGIMGASFVERFMFIYDALLREAQALWM